MSYNQFNQYHTKYIKSKTSKIIGASTTKFLAHLYNMYIPLVNINLTNTIDKL